MRRLTFVAILAFVVISLAQTAFAGPFYAVTDKFGYTGTITGYATLADARAGVNATSTSDAFPQRDGALYFIEGADNIFMTAWYYSTDPSHGASSGWGNPNNTNTGFVQLYDANGNTDSSVSAFWLSDLTTFRLAAEGANAGAADYARLWAAPYVGGAAALTAGTFVEWSLDFTATFATAAVEDSPGFFVSTEHPAGVTGTFRGIFQNTNSLDPSLNGFYAFTLNLNDENWAYGQGSALNGEFSPSAFGASAVPEPASLTLLGLGLAGIARAARRKR